MELLPAIDLRHGAAVRLTQGDFARERSYGDPEALAAHYIAGGARWIHVVDLDAARTGVPHERAALARIVRHAREAEVRVQAGGGIRTDEAAEELLESIGVSPWASITAWAPMASPRRRRRAGWPGPAVP